MCWNGEPKTINLHHCLSCFSQNFGFWLFFGSTTADPDLYCYYFWDVVLKNQSKWVIPKLKLNEREIKTILIFQNGFGPAFLHDFLRLVEAQQKSLMPANLEKNNNEYDVTAVPSVSHMTSCAKMLGQNHFAGSKWHVLICFLKIQIFFVEPL